MKFIADSMLGRLARWLRLLGFDTYYSPHVESLLIEIAREEKRVLLEGEIRKILGRKKLTRKIESLKNHYIICGYGRMGKIICNEMMQSGSQFIVIEKTAEVLEELVGV